MRNFPNIQSKSPLAQLEGVSSYPFPCYLGEEIKLPGSSLLFQDIQFLFLLPSFENLPQEQE